MKKLILFTTLLTAFSFALVACGKKPKTTTDEDSASTEIAGENNSNNTINATNATTDTITPVNNSETSNQIK
ncbi:MAG: hypothetical protein LBM96_04750 [Methanobrevibacter sp.]|jgi:hypothetical protein|nr:hypothetical protein [Candidatus Methanoflexus mossambicus]